MNFRNTIKQILFGSSISQDYLCVGAEGFDAPLSVYLTATDQTFLANVSDCHVFLGYSPMVMAVIFNKSSPQAEWFMQQDRVCFSFVQGSFTKDCRWRGLSSDQRAVARLLLKKIRTLDLGNCTGFILEGEIGEHQFLSTFYQSTNRLKEKFKKRNPGNVNLPGNLYDQVIIAYAVPRVISIITIVDLDHMNMFPSDLHGSVDGKFYLGSLRIGGKANDQVEKSETIVISRIDVDWYRNAYEAGKNHMASPSSPNNFKLSLIRSKGTRIPLPESVLSYQELRCIGSFDVGIHRIYSYEIMNVEKIKDGVTLGHIHRYYAQWRLNQGLLTKIFMR